MSLPKGEFGDRFDRIQAVLSESETDALVVSNLENVEYLGAGAGLDNAWYSQFSQSIAFPTIVVVPAEGEPTIVVQHLFKKVVEQTIGTLCELRTYYETGPEEEQPYVDMVVDCLEELGVAGGTIGVELGAGETTDPKIGMPVRNFRAIQRRLPNADFVDGSGVLRRLRMVKSDAEIEHIEAATEAIDQTFEACFEEFEPGMSEQEIVSVCNRLISEAGARPVWTLACTSPFEILPRADVTLDRGDTLFLDLGATVGSYHSDYNRMAVVGEPSDAQREHTREIAAITNSLAEYVEPGRTPAEIVDRCEDEFERRNLGRQLGLTSRTKIGHSIGLTLSEAPQLAGYDTTTLEPGMLLCIEPAITTEEAFYMAEQIVLVTENGSRVLSGADPGLYQI